MKEPLNPNRLASEDMGARVDERSSDPRQGTLTPPSISLPKGGGAIRGIGETFAANPVTGTGSLTVPIATSPGRSKLGPGLFLSYDSGAGNGPFGIGWRLSLPAIVRKTEKGVPRYLDDEASDVFILSGGEDLVPSMTAEGVRYEDDLSRPGFIIHRYRPRVEGLFSRIERWTRKQDGEVHWRTVSKENILTIYGRDAGARVADPKDPRRVFSWLISETRDDKGNAIVYDYKPDDGAGVDLARASEQNRGGRSDPGRAVNRYIKRIRYGNKTTLLDDSGDRPDLLSSARIEETDWLFEVVFDYGEHDSDQPTPRETRDWIYRPDTFSSYRSGFEVRTTRLCRRVLMFHHFDGDGAVGNDCLVKSTDFTYARSVHPDAARDPVYAFLGAVTSCGYIRTEEGYLKRSLPPLELEYSTPVVQERVETIDADSLENLPVGLDGNTYLWADLHGEGTPGILTEQADAWFYKRNLSPMAPEGARLAPMACAVTRPNHPLNGQTRLTDLAGDGRPDLVSPDGYYAHDDDQGWRPFRPFTARLHRDLSDPNLRFVDLNGDGRADVLITEENAFVWHSALGEEGYGPAYRTPFASDEEAGPRLLFADSTQSVHLADLSGDGLHDIVRIRNGEVCYWPNLGYARFGAKITMDHAPLFDHPDQFAQQRIRLADIDGSGTADIIYLHRDGVRLYYNQSGNSWSEAQILSVFPRVDDATSIAPVDLLGNGTTCLVRSSALPGDAAQPLRYVNLMGDRKPHLLVRIDNNLGAETIIRYAPSTKFYLQDREAGTLWLTRLPFPVHCVEEVVATDKWRKTRFSTRYTYHHGYFDGVEREFRGFARVEQVDAEAFGDFVEAGAAGPYVTEDQTLYQSPVKTVTWFHTGAHTDRSRIRRRLRDEFFPSWLENAGLDMDSEHRFFERALPEPDIEGLDIDADGRREALRACKGTPLRQEVYELDADALAHGREVPTKLFTATGYAFRVQCLQPRGAGRSAVFLTTENESVTYRYELDLTTPDLKPDPRIIHTMTLDINAFGQPLQRVVATYPRVRPYDDADPLLSSDHRDLIRRVQSESHLDYTEMRYTNGVDEPGNYRLPGASRVSRFELTGISPGGDADSADSGPCYFTPERLKRYRLSEFYQSEGATVVSIPYHRLPNRSVAEKRLIAEIHTRYFDADLMTPLPLGEQNHLGLVYETCRPVLTRELLDTVLREKLEAAAESGETYDETVTRILRFGGYVERDGRWWARSGVVGFAPDASRRFYLPERYVDPFGQVTRVVFDDNGLYLRQTVDPLGNTVTVERFNHRVLAPEVIRDPNDNLEAAAFDALGMIAGTAVMGKEGTETGDTLADFRADTSPEALYRWFTADVYDEAWLRERLGRATTAVFRCFGETERPDGTLTYGAHPACTCVISRETHVRQTPTETPDRLQAAFTYADGTGAAIVTKKQAEPETPGTPVRWLASGKTVLNNKGKTVKQYEPYFSEGGHRFEEPVEAGVASVMYYDALGRRVRTEQPDGAFSRVRFSPWFRADFDVNDTVLEPGNTWYARNSAVDATSAEQRTARLTAVHAGTPAVIHLDSLGREVLAVAHNRCRLDDETVREEKSVTFTKLDAEGRPLWVRDSRGNPVVQHLFSSVTDGDEPAAYVPCYDMVGNSLFSRGMDAGDRWTLSDVTGAPILSWDSRGNIRRTVYDALRRPTVAELRNERHAAWIAVGCVRYGDDPAWEGRETEAKARNLRGAVYKSFDQSGMVVNERLDFNGNKLTMRRRLAAAYDEDVDWRSVLTLPPDRDPDDLLMDEAFIQHTEYDALARPVRRYNWHGGVGARVSVTEPRYNVRNLLEQQEVVLDAVKTETGYEGGVRTAMIRRVTYSEKGERLDVTLGNETTTRYTYNPQTFRPAALQTRRRSDGRVLRQLRFTYDPSGNITEVADGAQPTVFFNNFRVEARNRYTYDARYRLIKAEGREHAGQVLRDTHDSWHDRVFRKQYHPNDPMAWRDYIERYDYDEVGNILSMRHSVPGDTAESWTRQYQYARTGNRLLATGIGASAVDHYPEVPTLAYRYAYNPHGSITAMPHLSAMMWDHNEHLHHIVRAPGTQGDPSLEAWYRYDATKQRVRKRILKQNGGVAERIYLGDVEIYREYDAGGVPTLARETLHIMNDRHRIALVDRRTRGDDGSPARAIRYQLGNHVGSAGLELNHAAEVISYEEYHPFGTTAYQAVRGDIEVSAKRYRYTGMERDEETGLGYHSARYLGMWLGRWMSCDPVGISAGLNRYQYCFDNPIRLNDPSGRCTDERLDELMLAAVGASDNAEADEHFEALLSGLSPPDTPPVPPSAVLRPDDEVSNPMSFLVNFRLFGAENQERYETWFRNNVRLFSEGFRFDDIGATPQQQFDAAAGVIQAGASEIRAALQAEAARLQSLRDSPPTSPPEVTSDDTEDDGDDDGDSSARMEENGRRALRGMGRAFTAFMRVFRVTPIFDVLSSSLEESLSIGELLALVAVVGLIPAIGEMSGEGEMDILEKVLDLMNALIPAEPVSGEDDRDDDVDLSVSLSGYNQLIGGTVQGTSGGLGVGFTLTLPEARRVHDVQLQLGGAVFSTQPHRFEGETTFNLRMNW